MDETKSGPANPVDDTKAKGPTNTEAVPVPGSGATPKEAAPAAAPASSGPARKGILGMLLGPGGQQQLTPEALQRLTVRKLRTLGMMLAVLGGLILFFFATSAFTYSKVQTWDERAGPEWTVYLDNATAGSLTLTYFDGSAASTATLAPGIGVAVTATKAHFTMTLDADNRTWSREMFYQNLNESLHLDANAVDPLPATLDPKDAYKAYIPAAGGLLILLGGVATFLRILRPLAILGSILLVLAGFVLGGIGGLPMILLIMGAGAYALFTVRKAKALFAEGLSLQTPPLPPV